MPPTHQGKGQLHIKNALKSVTVSVATSEAPDPPRALEGVTSQVTPSTWRRAAVCWSSTPSLANVSCLACRWRTRSASPPKADSGAGCKQMRWHLLLFGGEGFARAALENDGTCCPVVSARSFEKGAIVDGCMPLMRRCLLYARPLEGGARGHESASDLQARCDQAPQRMQATTSPPEKGTATT